MSRSEFGWSDLQADLLCDVMQRLEVDDFIRARAVCSWWNSTPKKTTNCRPKPQLPWLMLSSPSNPDSRYFYSLNSGEQQQADEENKKKKKDKKKEYHHELRVPGIAGQHCIGSSEGFVFTVDKFGEIHALNPLTGARLPLPSLATQPNMITVVRDSSGKPMEYIYLNTYTCPESTYAFDLDSMHSFYSKAIVAPSSRTVIVIHAGLFEALAFARPGDTSWSALPSPTNGASDIIFHKGLLHTIDFYGTLTAFDIDGDPSRPLFLSPPGPLRGEGGECRRFLVESPDSKDLFLVLKEYNGDYVKPRTKTCQVFKLDHTSLQWNRVQSMGECALFLGFNSSVSFSTYEFTNLKKGDIYFTDDYREVYFNNPDAVGDTGVFNLEDGTVRSLGSDVDLQKLNWPPPIWFAPML